MSALWWFNTMPSFGNEKQTTQDQNDAHVRETLFVAFPIRINWAKSSFYLTNKRQRAFLFVCIEQYGGYICLYSTVKS